ncbi:ABC transporter permease [Metabacillus fastidiosus]|uniref:ABC transporter permease n=1 Tax=Metabacillus fastidiosus TaxID=1458 RepID=UPI002E1E96B8|nr:ABC transporter permease [Metabacillus fastidiosus]
MTFRTFAFNNVIRNKRLYAAYFLSSMFTVMVFFTFAIFAFHPSLNGDNMNSHVSQGMYIAAGIIYVFSFFFILYSMSSFLQSRKKEFGLLMMQGMSMKQIRLMVFLENMLIGFIATIGGILLGVIFAKGILLTAENVLIIENKLNFYFPSSAIILTFISFMLLFFFISIFVSYILRSRKLIELIKGNKKSKGEPKANILLTIIAALLIGIGYTVALLAEGVAVTIVMLPVITVVIIGTYLFFTQLSVFVIRRLKKNENIFWSKTNMLLFSDLSFRMKDNARTFFMVAIISTVAFSSIGTLFGFQSFITAGTEITNPNTFTYQAEDYKEEEVAFIQETLRKENIKTEEARAILRHYEIEKERFQITKQSDFNRFAKLIGENTIDVKDGQLIAVKYEGIPFGQKKDPMDATIKLTSGETMKPGKMIESRSLPSSDFYYVVSDNDYKKLPAPTEEMYFHAWQATDGKPHVLDASEKIAGTIPVYKFTSAEYQTYQINKAYGPIMFVGLFIGIVFFVSAGSFLYFRLYMDLDEDKQKFKSIAKMGLTEKELKKVLNRQTAILFFAPITVALIHGAVTLTALSHLFYYDLFKESVIVLSVFLAIQIIYFFIVRFFYTKQIKIAVQ